MAATGSANVVVAGITLFTGQHHPLRHNQLESFRIVLPSEMDGAPPEDTPVTVDLGTLARKYAVPAFDPDTWLKDEALGLGEAESKDDGNSLIVDVTASPDATLEVAGRRANGIALRNGSEQERRRQSPG